MKRNYLSLRTLITLAGVLLSIAAATATGVAARSSGTTAEVVIKSGKTFDRKAPRELRQGISIKRELKSGDSHPYTVELAAGQYIHLVVQQQGIDVLVTVFGPGDEKLVEVDSPNGRYGPEPVSLISEKPGEYRLEITPLIQGAPGRYEITLEELRRVEEKDRDRIETERILAEAARLQSERTPESLEKSRERYHQVLLLLRTKGRRWADAQTLSAIEADTLHAIGLILRLSGESSQQAIEYFQQALPMRRAVGDQRGLLATLGETGMAYLRLGEHQKALEYLQQALSLGRAVGEQNLLAHTLNRVGITYTGLGDDQKAIAYLTEALSLMRATADRPGQVAVLTNLGGSFSQAGRLKDAINIYNQALMLARSLKDQRGEAFALSHIGQVYTWLREPQKSIQFLDQALLLTRNFGDRFAEAYVLSGIGEGYVALGRFEEGLRYLDQALSVHRSIRDRTGEALSLLRASAAERNLGRLEKARTQIEAALAIIESSRAALLKDDLRSSFIASSQPYYESYIDLLMRMHQEQPASGYDGWALEVAEKRIARSLLEMLTETRTSIQGGGDPVLLERQASLRIQVRRKADVLNKLVSVKHSEPQAITTRRELDDLLAEYDDLQIRIRTKSRRYTALTEPQPLSLKDIQRLLDDDTLLLEYSLGHDRSFLWVVSSKSIKSVVLPAQDQIETDARRVRDLLVKKADSAYAETLTHFSQMLLGPVADELGRKRLLIVAQGALHYIPFAALPEPTPEEETKNPGFGSPTRFQPLVLRHEVVNLPSASVLAELRREIASRQIPPKKIAVFADPVFASNDQRVITQKRRKPFKQVVSSSDLVLTKTDIQRSADELQLSSFARLPFSRREADLIASLVPNGDSEKAVDFEANLTRVRNPELADYQILHFATHSLLNNRHPGLSGIVLSLVDAQGQQQDGFLRLSDVYNLNLKADLVVLSACETALGKNVKGEGMVGLTRGFMYAGTPRVVASLWKVSDRATVELMKRFYENMLRMKMRPAAALRAAQISMSKDRQWAAPYYWAGFILQGEWR